MEETNALPTIGASYCKNVINCLLPTTNCLDLLVVTITVYEPSSGRAGAKNIRSLVLESNDVTTADTGTGEVEDTRETDTSEASTARMLEENRVTEVPPVVDTTEGDTKSMEGIGSVLGSKQ